MSQIGVIGSTGLVGRSIADILTREFQNSVVRFCKSSFSSQNLHDGHLVQLDILNLRQSLNLLEGFNTVFFCNGYTGHDYSSDDASRYFRSETELIKKLLKLDKRIIYFSSNKVELLKSSPVISLPPGLHRYLKHKRNMEDILLGYTNQTTIRLGKVIHEAYPRYKSWIESCGKLQSISVPENIYYEPIDIQDISNKVIRLFQAGLSGMHILQSSDSISYFHSANIVVQTFFQSTEYNYLINPTSLKFQLPPVILSAGDKSHDSVTDEHVYSEKVIEAVAQRMHRIASSSFHPAARVNE